MAIPATKDELVQFMLGKAKRWVLTQALTALVALIVLIGCAVAIWKVVG